MTLFAVRRVVGDFSRQDVDAAGLRALMCTYEFPGLRWVRSYWDQAKGELLCLYEAAAAEDVFEHSRRSRIPCDEVCAVIEIAPEEFTHG